FSVSPGSMLLVSVAVIVGTVVAQQNWFYIFAMIALCLLLLWPVPVALGIFAMLVPFDPVLVLSSGDHGRTLTWFVGAGAAITLLLTGVATGRLERPPRSAK